MKKFLDAKWLGLVVLNVLVIVFVCVKHQSSSINNNNLNGLEQKLITIQSQLNKPNQQPDLSLLLTISNSLGISSNKCKTKTTIN
ncbi:hypothetical protein PGH44_10130 [Legionella pneumophila]|nr:hypothetical protein PGH44_10130 [Legionella pneumophila]